MSGLRNRVRGGAGRWAVMAAVAMMTVWTQAAGAAGEADFISTPSERGAASFHHHLTRPGVSTTYIIKAKNIWTDPMDLSFELVGPSDLGAWTVALSMDRLGDLGPGDSDQVILTVTPNAQAAPGQTITLTVRATAATGETDRCEVVAETTATPKVYFLSIDSLHQDYLKLNAAGTGPGRDGDWLMPNLRRLMDRAVYYPNNKVHIIAATDMNHFNYLAGTMTGTSGIAMVGGFFFGFDEQGEPIIINSANLDYDLARYGEGKHVDSLMNVAKRMDPNAWTAFVSGKNWVPEVMHRPEFAVDRIIHGQRVPDFVTPIEWPFPDNREFVKRSLRALSLLPLGDYAHPLGNPAGNPEKQDSREQYFLARLISSLPSGFPHDSWVMDAALTELHNEDPDILYVLLAAVDDAGHAYGSAFELDEWNDRGTPDDISDDVSKYDPRASRQGMINVVRESDHQVGRFIEALERRGALDNSILIVESDHDMVTHYRRPMLDAKGYLKKTCPQWSPKGDYFIGSATSIGMVAHQSDSPGMLEELEAALESWSVKNPLTGIPECPLVVYNLEEMKTGVDAKTGKAWMLPGEYYSEFFVEHGRPGDQVWADLLLLSAPHYKFRVTGFGLGNLGAASLPFKLPEWGYFIGGHGSFETQPALLMMSVPGGTGGVNEAPVYAMDVAPTVYRLLGWPIPECVDGKGLPGIDPELGKGP